MKSIRILVAISVLAVLAGALNATAATLDTIYTFCLATNVRWQLR